MLKIGKKNSEKIFCIFVRSETFQTTLVFVASPSDDDLEDSENSLCKCLNLHFTYLTLFFIIIAHNFTHFNRCNL